MKRILKNGSRYIDWYGRASTKEAYEAYYGKPVEDSPPPNAVEPHQLNKNDPDWNVLIEDTDIPHGDKLIQAGILYLRDIPEDKEHLVSRVSGVGNKGANDISDHLQAEWGLTLK